MRRFILLFAATTLIFLGTRAYITHARITTASVLVVEAPSSAQDPFAPVTRAEGLMMTLRNREQFAPQLLWFTERLPEIPLFPDVRQKDAEAPYIEVAFLEGIMRGGSDGKFHPEEPLTSEQAIVLLSRAYRWTGGVPFASSPEIQNAESQWYTEAVSEAIDRNLIPEGSHLRLGSPISHDNFREMLRRVKIAEEERTYAYIENKESPTKNLSSMPASSSPLRITPLQAPTIPLPDIAPPESASLAYASTKYFAITIPALGIMDMAVTHPADPFTEEGILAPLEQGAGHLFSYPGSGGKTMIYAHSSNWPWKNPAFAKVFRQLDTLATGERVYVTYAKKLYVYEVTGSVITSPQDTSNFEDDGMEELILYTCYPKDSVKERLLKFTHVVEVITL